MTGKNGESAKAPKRTCSMNIGALATASSRPLQERSQTTGTPAEPTPDPSDPLAVLENFVESANLSRKAFAEDRLKHLKEQMNTLMLFNLAPGFLVNHSARMARELEAAAGDFAKAFKALGTEGQSPSQEPSMDGSGGAAADDPIGSAPASSGSVPPAYLEILGSITASNSDQPGKLQVMNQQDAETLAGFTSVARHLSSVIELAMNDDEQNHTLEQTAADAKASASRVVDTMARLQGPSASALLYW